MYCLRRHVLKTRDFIGRGRLRGGNRKLKEPRRFTLPRGSRIGFYGDAVHFWVVSGPAFWLSILPGGCTSLSPDGCQQRGFWGVGRTYGLASPLSPFDPSWITLVCGRLIAPHLLPGLSVVARAGGFSVFPLRVWPGACRVALPPDNTTGFFWLTSEVLQLQNSLIIQNKLAGSKWISWEKSEKKKGYFVS